jgi:hypothetical protein
MNILYMPAGFHRSINNYVKRSKPDVTSWTPIPLTKLANEDSPTIISAQLYIHHKTLH